MISRIRRAKEEGNYTIIPNAVCRDVELRRSARGLLVELLSRPANWHVSVPQLINAGKEGKDSIYSMLRELIASGYIIKTTFRDDRGRIRGVEYLVYSQRQSTEKSHDEQEPMQEPEQEPMQEPEQEAATTPAASKSKERRQYISIPADMPAPHGVSQGAWQNWLNYRKQTRSPVRPESLEQFSILLKCLSDDCAVPPDAIINQSIAQGWLGIYPLAGKEKEPWFTSELRRQREEENAEN